MSKLKLAVNGFGRIGRVFFRRAWQHPSIEVVAINDLTDAATLAHLLKYDSVHGVWQEDIRAGDSYIDIGQKRVEVSALALPDALPWASLGVDVVLESTGKLRSLVQAQGHLRAGAKTVLLSAPPKGPGIGTYVMGINEHLIEAHETVLSNASCTTNSCAHIVKYIDQHWGIVDGYLSTVHAYTGDQRLHDAPHADLRRARAAARSMIPTSTGAAQALITVFPHLDGHLVGSAIRVPTESGSITELTFQLQKPAEAQQVNELFRSLSAHQLKGILAYNEDPIVSIDIVGNPHSGIFDGTLTHAMGHLLKVSAWYDNETGYASRCVDMMAYLGSRFF
ncbi:MAG: type I glyceraldehyde-3-phosphate dehydrogenase [Bacteroidetes bacterium]|jgi:glyceraldehyde 3-phosphate dehydrogenase|nr:type I glyceraldehyde-3-phosphate dehydrogenase [Bacteroidota bacterium]